MKLRGIAIRAAAVFVLGTSLFMLSAGAAEPTWERQEASRVFSWALSEAAVTNPGTTATIPEGILTQGFVVESKATALSGSPQISEGALTLTVTAFTPFREMPGQTPGVWYLRGTWTVRAAQAEPREDGIRHDPSSLSGLLNAELPFNPATQPGAFEATILMPPASGAEGWAYGRGTFSVDDQFEGSMDLALNRR